MLRPLRTRFWVQCAIVGLNAVLAAATLVWPDWIERLFGVDPDGGDGSLEWLLVALPAGLMVVFFLLARAEWRRPRAQSETR